jgi:hypothetical protein
MAVKHRIKRVFVGNLSLEKVIADIILSQLKV